MLDVDATADPAHGQQAFAFFHGHYDQTILFPMLGFDGDGRLVTLRLRPGNTGNYRYTGPMLERVFRLLKACFRAVAIVVRGDADRCGLIDRGGDVGQGVGGGAGVDGPRRTAA